MASLACMACMARRALLIAWDTFNSMYATAMSATSPHTKVREAGGARRKLTGPVSPPMIYHACEFIQLEALPPVPSLGHCLFLRTSE